MLWMLLSAAALSALLAIACEERRGGRHAAFFALKPLTTLLILAAAASAESADPAYRQGICIALALSMCGDIALMFAGNAAFMAGLGSFLIAHGVFVWVFLADGAAAPPLWTAVVVLAALAYFVWLLPRTGPLKIPVVIYGVVLVAMSLVAAGRLEWRQDSSGLLALGGALVFLVSDSALAACQFWRPYPRAQTLILSTYWTAIALLAASVAGSGALAP